MEKSSAQWHEGRHDIWPYVNYLLFTFDELYDGFEERFARLGGSRGEKTALVEDVLESMDIPFTIREIDAVLIMFGVMSGAYVIIWLANHISCKLQLKKINRELEEFKLPECEGTK